MVSLSYCTGTESERRKTTNTLEDRVADVSAKIRIEHLPNISLQRYH
jgi:hypothetical protein